MAEAPGHKLGQIVGTALELAVEPFLRDIAEKYSLYLDKQGERPARPGKKVTWSDNLGNKHDLDYVMERGGTDEKQGVPVAFIESAWRRYTKHSRNKAQEIQGAILPLLATHSESKPFAGVVAAGVFTKGSLDQLRSNNFEVLYIPYEKVIAAFQRFGIGVEYDESSPDKHLQRQIDRFDKLTESQLEELGDALRETVPKEFKRFAKSLRTSLGRRVTRVLILPLHGSQKEFGSIDKAIKSIEGYEADSTSPFVKFEIQIHYSNDDRIQAEFRDRDEAIRFLSTFTEQAAL